MSPNISQGKYLHVKHPITLQSQAERTPTALKNREAMLPQKPIKTDVLSSGTHEMGYECIAIGIACYRKAFFRSLLAPFPDSAAPLWEQYTEILYLYASEQGSFLMGRYNRKVCLQGTFCNILEGEVETVNHWRKKERSSSNRTEWLKKAKSKRLGSTGLTVEIVEEAKMKIRNWGNEWATGNAGKINYTKPGCHLSLGRSYMFLTTLFDLEPFIICHACITLKNSILLNIPIIEYNIKLHVVQLCCWANRCLRCGDPMILQCHPPISPHHLPVPVHHLWLLQ